MNYKNQKAQNLKITEFHIVSLRGYKQNATVPFFQNKIISLLFLIGRGKNKLFLEQEIV